MPCSRWSLLGKVLPPRLRLRAARRVAPEGPVGLWNQLALVAVFALPLALWRRRLEGVLLAYAALVALLLTYSRGGLLTAVLVLAAWLVLSEERLESGATLVAAALPAAVVVGVAFALPGVTSDGQSSSTRWRDGLVFGVVLLAGAAARPRCSSARRARATRRASVGRCSRPASSRPSPCSSSAR